MHTQLKLLSASFLLEVDRLTQVKVSLYHLFTVMLSLLLPLLALVRFQLNLKPVVIACCD
jgi:hypothetical protein